ncbi:hypothetical protein SAMN04488121_102322 [Chitinophaga filiformis]|uniref:Uncharacterized protein n=1 Tax=Chitinophaga filiformis TaxID=104663 RepID=A0A1G7M7Z5_CHIFI|nr:hypothetical protein SAMN04488121_102322 [Chitinophaga filiformis]
MSLTLLLGFWCASLRLPMLNIHDKVNNKLFFFNCDAKLEIILQIQNKKKFAMKQKLFNNYTKVYTVTVSHR